MCSRDNEATSDDGRSDPSRAGGGEPTDSTDGKSSRAAVPRAWLAAGGTASVAAMIAIHRPTEIDREALVSRGGLQESTAVDALAVYQRLPESTAVYGTEPLDR